ncbi:MAG: L-threonine aldolase [Ramlibacter sp.]|nr:L-threonine aldolase [Ramlibacter sp.]
MQDQVLDFRSDNTGCVAPQLIDALHAANTGSVSSYGADPWTERLQLRMSELFETSVRVFPVATGTAGNALSLAAACTSFGAVYSTPEAHINTSELNATGFFASGAKVTPVPSPRGKLEAGLLADLLKHAGGWPHKSQPAAVNLVQATDLGEVYQVSEVDGIAKVARAHGLKVHMDGARFANAVAHLGCTPAQITWKAGVDILSFGATKNGGLLSDAIVVFSPEVAPQIDFHLRRAGLVWSKMRYASAQLMAYVEDGLWLQLARQANDGASRVAADLQQIGVRLASRVQANEVFAELPAPVLDSLRDAGVLFARRGSEQARFVCRWDNTAAELDGLVAAIRTAVLTEGGRRPRP